MSLRDKAYAWYLVASVLLAFLAALTTAAHGVVAVAFSIIPQSVVLLIAGVFSADIDRWSMAFRTLVFAAGVTYYLAIIALPGALLKSAKAKVAVSLTVHLFLSLSVFWYALFLWQR